MAIMVAALCFDEPEYKHPSNCDLLVAESEIELGAAMQNFAVAKLNLKCPELKRSSGRWFATDGFKIVFFYSVELPKPYFIGS